MGSKTDWLEAKLTNWWYGRDAAPVVPTSWWFALSTAPYNETALGTAMNEVGSGLGYSRISLANDHTSFPSSSSTNPTEVANAIAVNFPSASADWGTIYSVYLCDASTDGNAWFGTNLGTPTSVLSGGSCNIPVGAWIHDED